MALVRSGRKAAICVITLVTLLVVGTCGCLLVTDEGSSGPGDEREVLASDLGDERLPAARGPSPSSSHATTKTTRQGGAREAASTLLRSYRDQGDCTLAQQGYLDLLGRVWGCVIQGDGWTDLCVISEATDGTRSDVWVTRLVAEEAADELGLDDVGKTGGQEGT